MGGLVDPGEDDQYPDPTAKKTGPYSTKERVDRHSNINKPLGITDVYYCLW